MITLLWKQPDGIDDVQQLVQTAIDLEFSTLPPYLYAKFTILPGTNEVALARLNAIIGQEMIHMCLACNILNAVGGTPAINPPHYPGPLPGGVDGGVVTHLLPFSPEAMAQGMAIEEPSEAIKPRLRLLAGASDRVTIGEFYHRLDGELAKLPSTAWSANSIQFGDAQFFQGQLFAVKNYSDAHSAIGRIVSEGEGTPVTPDNAGSPLDFQNDLAHYYRFWEMYKNQVLTKDPTPPGYAWGEPLGVDWTGVYPAIADPQEHDFSKDSLAAQTAQATCDSAFTAMVDALGKAFAGDTGGLGVAVRAMFDLRMAAMQALQTPLKDGKSVAGPAFRYIGTGQAKARSRGKATKTKTAATKVSKTTTKGAGA